MPHNSNTDGPPENQRPPKTDDPFDPASNPELVARPPGLPATEAEEKQQTLFERSLTGGLVSARLKNLPAEEPEEQEEPEDIPVYRSMVAASKAAGIVNALAQGTLSFEERRPATYFLNVNTSCGTYGPNQCAMRVWRKSVDAAYWKCAET